MAPYIEPKPVRYPRDDKAWINLVNDLQEQRDVLLEWIARNGEHAVECYEKQQQAQYDNPNSCWCHLRQILRRFQQPLEGR